MEMQIGFSNLLPCLLCQSTHKSVGRGKTQGAKELKIRWGFLTFTRDLWKIIKDSQKVAFINEPKLIQREYYIFRESYLQQISPSNISLNQ